MSFGISAMTWLGLGTLVTTAAIANDANKAAKHQGRLQNELTEQALRDADRIAAEERALNERLAAQQLEEQRAMQEASLAAAEKQAAESRALMDKQLKASEENTNKAMQKRPNTAGIMASAQQAGKSGASGTMLTGPQGISTESLTLGKATLLGM